MRDWQEEKQQRYEELLETFEHGDCSDEELCEQVKLFFELYPEYVWWMDGRTPEEIWREARQARTGRGVADGTGLQEHGHARLRVAIKIPLCNILSRIFHKKGV